MYVLVTRPEPQASELCQLIQQLGISAVPFPTIAFAPPPDVQAFQAAVQALDQQDWVIFISPQAVRASAPYLKVNRAKIAAIGGGTAKALREIGYTNVLHPLSEWHSEGLLELPEFQTVSGQKIAIVRGVGGREWVDQALAERGAQITTIMAYERVLPEVDVQPCLKLLKKSAITYIICTSFEAARNLKVLLGEMAWPLLQTVPMIVMSERVKLLARDLGFQTIWVTQNASQAAILAFLAEKRTT